MSDIHVTTIVNEILRSCTYVLSKKGKDGVFLIDCGDSQQIFDYVKSHRKKVSGVLLTHCHYDHIYGLKDLLAKYPTIQVFASDITFKGLEDINLNMSYLYTDDDFIVPLSVPQKMLVKYDVCFSILCEHVQCIFTPGHHIDCTTYIINDKIFTGDSYNPNAPVYTKWQNSNMQDAQRSEMMIRQLIAERKLAVFPGHKI